MFLRARSLRVFTSVRNVLAFFAVVLGMSSPVLRGRQRIVEICVEVEICVRRSPRARTSGTEGRSARKRGLTRCGQRFRPISTGATDERSIKRISSPHRGVELSASKDTRETARRRSFDERCKIAVRAVSAGRQARGDRRQEDRGDGGRGRDGLLVVPAE